MGQSKSRTKDLDAENRNIERFGRSASSSFSWSSSIPGSLPSTANSSRLPSIEYAEDQSMFINQQLQGKICLSQRETLTPRELNLVHTTWQNVISDSSNICLNFFQQVKKSKKAKRRWQPRACQSTPFSNATTCNPSAKFLQAGSKHNDQIYYALRLSCCMDRLIFKLRVEDSCPIITNRRWNSDHALDDNGELLEFLELDKLSEEEQDEMIMVLVDTIKLVTIHSQKSKSNSSINEKLQWSDEIKSAWIRFLKILIQELKDS